MTEQFELLKNKYSIVKGRLSEKKDRLNTVQESVDSIEQNMILYDESLKVLTAIGWHFHETVFSKIDTMVTDGLRVVCENDQLEFKTQLEQKRGQPEVSFLYRDGTSPDYGDLLFTHGGGIVDIISCALRLIFAELIGIDGFIMFDEPARMLHSESTQHEKNFITFMRNFSEIRDRQMIIITHSTQMADIGNKHVRVRKNANGVSEVVDG